jgi:rhodanese-related sulfurtransferase
MENRVFTDQARKQIKEISPSEVYRAKVIIDVRQAAAFSTGRIAGAINLHADLLERRIAEVVKDLSTPILVYCSIGKESPSSAEKLVNLGYQDVSLLKGGLYSWLEAGGTLELRGKPTKSSQQRAWWRTLWHGLLASAHTYKKGEKTKLEASRG